MKPSNTAARSTVIRRLAIVGPLALAVLLLWMIEMNGCKGGVAGFMAKHHPRRSKTRENTTDYASNVQAVVNSPQLAILKWANYSDYQPQVQQFYNNRNYELAWTRDGRPTQAATELIALFENAAQKGLRPADYDASRWAERVQKLDEIRTSHDTSDNAHDNIAEFDAAVTISAMRYVSDLHLGRINPQTLNFDIDVPERRAAFDLPTFVDSRLVDSEDVAAVTATVEPQSAMYAETERALVEYIQLAKEQDANPAQPLPPVERALTTGARYPALEALVQRLQLEGDAGEMRQPRFYDADLSAAVRRYQERHGMAADGKLTQATIDSLNIPMEVRVQQLDDSLERWRWLPENFANPRVFVNLPEFMVRAYEPDHTLAFKMKVVDGEAKGEHDTPMFVRSMRYMIFRPYWNLPPDIVKKELVNHLGGDGGQAYMDRNNYEVTTASGKPVTNWTVDDLQHARFLVRQKPGPGNALGLVKFMFPNEYDVYMHSTPEMRLFQLTRRDRSHGCIRLEDAEKMADWVLGGESTYWDADKIHDAMYKSDAPNNKAVGLKTTLPVLVGYFTAIVEDDGSVHFFDDIYGYDKQMEAALAEGMPYERAMVKINPKLVPGDTD